MTPSAMVARSAMVLYAVDAASAIVWCAMDAASVTASSDLVCYERYFDHGLVRHGPSARTSSAMDVA